jgi:anti-sigma B factor antagonist
MATNCNVRNISEVTILDLSGRLSLAEAAAFGPGSGVVLGEIIRDLTKQGRKKFLLNLAGVTYVDSSGVGQLVGALTSARHQGGDVKLLNPNSHVLDLLKATKLETIFDIQTDEATAVYTFSRGAAAGA